jgi:hypothetical protein
MRRYYGRDHRVLRDGSIEINGTWAGVQPIALGLAGALLLMLMLRMRLLLVPGIALGLYLLVLPTRRRVTFDASAHALRIEHAGPFCEAWSRSIPFDQISVIRLTAAGRRGSRAVREAVARTARGDVYLLSLVEGAADAALEERVYLLLTA